MWSSGAVTDPHQNSARSKPRSGFSARAPESNRTSAGRVQFWDSPYGQLLRGNVMSVQTPVS
jgi:hypothetical protein